MSKNSTFNTSIHGWLSAMRKAGRIQPGGRLVFVNKQSGAVVPSTPQVTPSPDGSTIPTN